jgi:hypothetical protein
MKMESEMEILVRVDLEHEIEKYTASKVVKRQRIL